MFGYKPDIVPTNRPQLQLCPSQPTTIPTLYQWLRWSRGSMLPLSTQVRGFKPGRSRQDFSGGKILSTPSFGGEVKPSVPCRRFAACKRSLNETWRSTFRQNYRPTFSPTVPPFAARISHVVWTWRRKWECLKITGGDKGHTISL